MLLRIVNAPLTKPVDSGVFERGRYGCAVGRCNCSTFTCGEARRYHLVPVTAECVCGHALMYHSRCVHHEAVPAERYHAQTPAVSSSALPPHEGVQSHLEHARLETALLHAHQAERVVQMKLSKYRHACSSASGADVAHARHSLQEAFKISLRSLEDLGAARASLVDSTDSSALLRHESVCVMRRLMECCEYAQRELALPLAPTTNGLVPQKHPAVCPNCDEMLDPKLGKYCGNCGHCT